MIIGSIELNQQQKPLHDQLVAVLENPDDAVMHNLVSSIHEVPDYILLMAIGRDMVDRIAILAPKCTDATITRGLNRMIMGSVQFNMQAVCALLPYAPSLNQVMANACAMGRTDLVEHLYPLCGVPDVLALLKRCSGGKFEHVEFWKTTLQQRLNDEKLRDMLNSELSSSTENSKRKM